MSNLFTSVSAKVPKRNKFNLSHETKLTGEMGELLPIFCEPTLPGDRFKLSCAQLVRMAPLTAPIMANIDVYTHFFFVPNRIIWDEWETFITASKKGKKLKEEDLPVPPRLKIPASLLNKAPQSGGIQDANWDGRKYASNCSLIDYLGYPTLDSKQVNNQDYADYFIDELPLRAYQKVYFDWYRDENLSSFDDFDLINSSDYNNGDNSLDENFARGNMLLKLQRRSWKKDYFTSALPWAQKGDDVIIPGSGGSVNVNDLKVVYKEGPAFVTETSTPDSGSQVGYGMGQNIGVDKGYKGVVLYGSGKSYPISINYNSFGVEGSKIGNSEVSEGTIRELRRAMAAQRFLEREAVGGTRYIEQIAAFFGVKSSDARLQRPQFLGGSKNPIVVSQVLQTSGAQMQNGEVAEGATPLAQPAGNAVAAGGKYIFDYSCEEHGFIIGIMSIMPKADYMNGMPKKYLKRDRFDYYWPQFAHIGEQPIETQELWYDFSALGNEEPDPNNPLLHKNRSTWGYTPRYAEYRFINNHIHGDFKDTLAFWTLARKYGEGVAPFLNETFIECNPSKRIYAYEDSDFNHLWIQVAFNVKALRPLPKYGESI